MEATPVPGTTRIDDTSLRVEGAGEGGGCLDAGGSPLRRADVGSPLNEAAVGSPLKEAAVGSPLKAAFKVEASSTRDAGSGLLVCACTWLYGLFASPGGQPHDQEEFIDEAESGRSIGSDGTVALGLVPWMFAAGLPPGMVATGLLPGMIALGLLHAGAIMQEPLGMPL